MGRVGALLVSGLLLTVAGCQSRGAGGADPSASAASPGGSSSSSPVRPSASPSSIPSLSASTSLPPDVDELVVPAAAAALPSDWRQVFVVDYGRGRQLLGTSPGGDSGSLDLGPDYGAPAPDGSWWFLDAAKARLAHYDAAGAYLGQVHIPTRLLVDHRYFQWQLLHVLADGTLLAARQTPGGTRLLRLRGGVLDEVPVHGSFSPTYDDGQELFGFAGDGRTVAVDVDGRRRPVTTYPTPAGTTFTLTLSGRGLRLTLPEQGVSRRLPVVTASGARAHVGVQLRAGADGTLHLYLTGTGADDDTTQLVGYTSVSPTGRVAPVEALPNPYTEADPGSPAQLELAAGATEPMLVYVLPDGVHVYTRSG